MCRKWLVIKNATKHDEVALGGGARLERDESEEPDAEGKPKDRLLVVGISCNWQN